MIRKIAGIGIAVAVVAAGVSVWYWTNSSPATVRGSGDELAIAATGDSMLVRPLPSSWFDPGLGAVGKILRSSGVAITNLEENILDPARIPRSDNPGDIRWPHGSEQTAKDLRRMGITMLSLANNHAVDYTAEGLAQTGQLLDRAGLAHAGTGEDLAAARAPVYIGTSPRRIALIAVAASASPESRATPSRGDIVGRAGVNALKYAPDVTVDATTFATLQKSPVTTPDAKPSDRELIVSGKSIKKGERTAVEIKADSRDTEEILERIREARQHAEIVIVSMHTHEPSNQSEVPADFMRQFAHSAIDAGANLVIGSGPHRIRGIEVYKGSAVFYSLGNFAFEFSSVDPRSEDAFEAGYDLYRLAMGAISDTEPAPHQPASDPAWWQSVIAVANFEKGSLRSVRLQPIELGQEASAEERGLPRFASPERGAEILKQLEALSQPYGTQIRIENAIGFIDISPSKP